MTGEHGAQPPSPGPIEAPPLKPLDRLLQRWRFRKAATFVRAGDRILDVGCADGALFRYLGERLGEGVGVDPSLRRDVVRGRYRLLAQPFPGALSGESFDVITMLAVLEHLPPDALRDTPHACATVLRPGGRVVITVPSPTVDRILHWLERLRLIRGIGLHEHHGFNPATTQRLFSQPNFRLLGHRRFQLGLNNLFVFERISPHTGS
jgi:SAM-dependent methyltransferase